ncbi:MAG: hypothetical protein AUK02_00530 [Anaerolineae bacterium CG2_30_58_95]|nr:MAG: hypothetical protein AUK02_00530 [Anaerolineae bacterium CG2_30_58_95]
MAEVTGIPIAPPPPPTKKSNTWLIAIVIVIVVCCCCFGLIGLLIGFGPDILNELGIYVLTPALATVM